MGDKAETKVLEWGSQRLVISKAVGEILTPWLENQDQVGVENRAESQELWKRNQRKAGGENLPETQACRGEKQEQLRCKIDAESQTPMWETQDRSRNKDAVETQSFEKNKKGARGEDEGETQAQGSRKQGQTGSENGEETQLPGWEIQDQIRGDTITEIQVEERRKKDQVGGENAVQIQITGRENLGEMKREDGLETHALGWGKQECVQSENVTQIQTPEWKKQDEDGSEKAGKVQVFRVEIQKQLRYELQVGWGNQGLKRGQDAGESQMSRRKSLREIREEDWIVIQARCWGDQKPAVGETGREFKVPPWGNQDQTGSEHRAKIQALEKSDQRKDGDEDGTNSLAPEAEKQRQLRGVTHVETHPPGRRNQELFGDENSTDIQATGKRNLRGVKGDDGKETQELGEENQHQLNSEINGKIHIPKSKNQEYIRGKDGSNTQASEAENWGELTSKIDIETHSAEWKKEEQVGGENGAEIQAPEKRNQREAGGEDGTETWAPGEEDQSQLRGDIDEKTHLSDRKNQEQMGGENETEIQAPEKRPQREAGGEGGKETQPPGGDYQGGLRSEIDGEIQIQGQRNQNKSEDEDAAEIQDARSQRKCRAKDAGGLRVPRGRNKGQVRGKDAAKGNLRVDCSGGEGPSALTGFGYGAMDEEQAVASAPHPEMKPLLHQSELFQLASGEGEHLASHSTATAGKHRVGVIPASRQARPKLQRSRQSDKGVAPEKTSGLTRQLQNPQSLAAPLGLPSACPSVSCGQAPQAATALVGVPTALTALPKWPALKKSQRLLLESLMRRKIAHLKWGLPRRILESYLHFNFLGPCPLPVAGVRLPGLHVACELQGQQERHCEAQASRPGLKSPERSQRVRPPERRSSKLPTQARALEKREPHPSQPMGISVPPKKPKRVKPLGGPREPQDVQKEAPSRAELTAPRNPWPAAESSSWCGQERVQEPSTEGSRGREMVRTGVSQMAERAPSKARISHSRAGYDHWRKEHVSQGPPRLKCQQPTHRRRGSLEPEEGRGTGQQPSSCSTDAFSSKRSLHSAAARLSISFLNKISLSPLLAKPQHSASSLSVRDPDPTLLPKGSHPPFCELPYGKELRRPLDYSHQESEALSPAAFEEMNPASNHLGAAARLRLSGTVFAQAHYSSPQAPAPAPSSANCACA
ncbi:uncharacterized protein LOC130857572 [Hippopotamus amphibius kiboko]|uniref:uncharacterized protein LOC130857572 n=1 Tax=Hippopotamus amphibius kiboko TaxID=575201 RepID=UPI00259AB47F|nr:uncharacterized protein LOC130857572 [Hippopotamus amphibius kiboko]